MQAFFKRLAVNHTIVKYDKHGCGLSDRDRTEFSLEKEVRDLEAIIDHLKLQRFALFGMSEGGPTAITYAVKHPKFVSHLILYGTWPRGNAGAPPELKASLCNLIRTSWGLGSKTLADIFVPDSGMEGLRFFTMFQRKAATGEMAAQLLEAEEHIDVTEVLQKVVTPTLIMHRKGDRACSVQGGRELAASIPNARFVLLERIDHIPWFGDSDSVMTAVEEFLGDETVFVSKQLAWIPTDIGNPNTQLPSFSY
jgi:pimeloyl-ACP methyl ester carboxylesterase